MHIAVAVIAVFLRTAFAEVCSDRTLYLMNSIRSITPVIRPHVCDHRNMASSAENGDTENSISPKGNKEAEEAKTKANEFFKGRFCTELNAQTLFVCAKRSSTRKLSPGMTELLNWMIRRRSITRIVLSRI